MLEDLPEAENPNESFYFSPESPSDMMQSDNLPREMTVDTQSFTSNVHSARSSRYLKTHAFSPSLGVEERDISGSEFNACDSERKGCPQTKVSFSICFYLLCLDLLISIMGVKANQNDMLDQLEYLLLLFRSLGWLV